MGYYPTSLEKLIIEFSRFSGVGQRSAEKMAFNILKWNNKEVENLCEVLLALKEKVTFCKKCFNITEEDECIICKDIHRDRKTICVVEKFKDVISIEKTHEYKGLYHILQGHLSPIKGIGPDDLTIKELISRIKLLKISEVIIATNPNIEGDATSLYLADVLKPLSIKVTRVARGLPIGGDLEFADPITLSRSIVKREDFNL